MSKATRKQYGYDRDHLYTIQSDPEYGILAGQSKSYQWLISEQPKGILIIKFDRSGNLIEKEFIEIEKQQKRTERLDLWKAEIGFEKKQVQVRKFFLNQYQIGIADLPSGMQEAIDDPDEFDGEELDMVLEDINGWLNDSQFVLQWGNEYFLNANGEIVSS